MYLSLKKKNNKTTARTWTNFSCFFPRCEESKRLSLLHPQKQALFATSVPHSKHLALATHPARTPQVLLGYAVYLKDYPVWPLALLFLRSAVCYPSFVAITEHCCSEREIQLHNHAALLLNKPGATKLTWLKVTHRVGQVFSLLVGAGCLDPQRRICHRSLQMLKTVNDIFC